MKSSLPGARKGSPWQQQDTWRRWARTGWNVLRHPKRSFDEIRLGAESDSRLLTQNAFVGAGMALTPLWIHAGSTLWDELDGFADRGSVLAGLIPGLAVMAIVMAVSWLGLLGFVLVLTAIEARGLRLIGRVHGWRVTAVIARGVCAHASYGWVIAGPLVGLAGAVLLFADPDTLYSIFGDAWSIWVFGVAAGLTFAGLFIFETLVYIGVRRCKFANSAEPGIEPPARTSTAVT